MYARDLGKKREKEAAYFFVEKSIYAPKKSDHRLLGQENNLRNFSKKCDSFWKRRGRVSYNRTIKRALLASRNCNLNILSTNMGCIINCYDNQYDRLLFIVTLFHSKPTWQWHLLLIKFKFDKAIIPKRTCAKATDMLTCAKSTYTPQK